MSGLNLPSGPTTFGAFVTVAEHRLDVLEAAAFGGDPGGGSTPPAVTDALVSSVLGQPLTSAALAAAVDARSGNGQRPVGRGELVLNVRHYGATGDGVTDASAAIQSAIDAASSGGGGTVYLPPGRYVVNAPLMLKSDVTLQGAGWGSVLVKAANVNGSVLDSPSVGAASKVSRAMVLDLRIDGNKGAHTSDDGPSPSGGGTLRYGLNLQYMEDFLVQRVLVHDTVLDGMYISGTRIHVKDCTVRDVGKSTGIARPGIIVAGESGMSAEGHVITGNIVENVGEHGIKLYPNCHGAVISANTIKDCGRWGIYVAPSHYVAVTGNTVDGAGQAGIMIGESGGPSNYCTVAGNTVTGSAVEGILVNASAGCAVTGNTVVGNARHGILLQNSPRATVSGNTATANGSADGCGITLYNSSDVTLTGNVCADNGNAAFVDSCGIWSWDTSAAGVFSRYVTVTGNRCLDTGAGVQRYGVRTTQQSNFWLVTGNTLAGNTTAPTSMVGADNVVSGNL